MKLDYNDITVKSYQVNFDLSKYPNDFTDYQTERLLKIGKEIDVCHKILTVQYEIRPDSYDLTKTIGKILRILNQV